MTSGQQPLIGQCGWLAKIGTRNVFPLLSKSLLSILSIFPPSSSFFPLPSRLPFPLPLIPSAPVGAISYPPKILELPFGLDLFLLSGTCFSLVFGLFFVCWCFLCLLVRGVWIAPNCSLPSLLSFKLGFMHCLYVCKDLWPVHARMLMSITIYDLFMLDLCYLMYCHQNMGSLLHLVPGSHIFTSMCVSYFSYY